MGKNNDTTKTSAGELRKDAYFREMCLWIEKNLFGYDQNQHIQTMAVLRLSGLRHGKAVANNAREDFGNYPWEVIFLTFKANKVQIQRGIKGKTFESEANKMAYICAIVRDKINDMYTRWNNAKKTQEKVEQIDTDILDYEGAEYTKKESTSNNMDDKFKDLW